ncbi:hypothetical protein PENSUB_1927 [Penicillium subrubescens]|uniref:Uncharacterized protein n=1 Tax=Penicillium subrubescens TaxID=1316194 RepID=A0A1Q5UJ14_9EURO|nr:hypothetical protein PENSUB_1927 [Penicillium subrubescens]
MHLIGTLSDKIHVMEAPLFVETSGTGNGLKPGSKATFCEWRAKKNDAVGGKGNIAEGRLQVRARDQ